jgi:hypothetical protein
VNNATQTSHELRKRSEMSNPVAFVHQSPSCRSGRDLQFKNQRVNRTLATDHQTFAVGQHPAGEG